MDSMQWMIYDTISNEFWSKASLWNFDEVEIFETLEEAKKCFDQEAGKRIGAEILQVKVEQDEDS